MATEYATEPVRSKQATREVITLATGKPVYISMAINLARSFRRWHPNTQITFTVATDRPDLIPADLTWIKLIELKSGQFGEGFSPKLHLDKIVSCDTALFIDADCLCVGNLDSVFERFNGKPVGVVGKLIKNGDWFGNVESVLSQFALNQMPKFNGGIYYVEKGSISSKIYEKARELEPRYDEIGLIRLRGRPNDELLLAIAMGIHNISPIEDDGSIMSDPQACPGTLRLNVLSGGSKLENPPLPDPRNQPWYPLQIVSPLIVHFLGGHTDSWIYRRQSIMLDLWCKGYSIFLSRLAAGIRTTPEQIKTTLKSILRPAYHRFFGPRNLRHSDRI